MIVWLAAEQRFTMKILAFDTSSDKMYVAIGENSTLITSKIVETTKGRYNSAILIPTIIELLKQQDLKINDIDAIGVNIGPGSFTGIKASVTVAKVLSSSLNIGVVGIPSLEMYSCINNTEKDSLCLLDARKGKSYISIYSPEGKKLYKPSLLKHEEILTIAGEKDYFIITDKAISEILALNDINCINIEDVEFDFGHSLISLTFKYLSSGQSQNYTWETLKPLYIQPPPIYSL